MKLDEITKKLKKLTKKELFELIKLMMNKNDNNRQLIYNLLNNNNPKTKLLVKKIRREVESPDGSYYEAYRLLTDYVETSTDTKTILELSIELLEYFFIEIEAYDRRYPETLFEFTLNTYEIALKAAFELRDIKAADELYSIIRFEEEGFEVFLDAFYGYFNIDDDENVILYEKE